MEYKTVIAQLITNIRRIEGIDLYLLIAKSDTAQPWTVVDEEDILRFTSDVVSSLKKLGMKKHKHLLETVSENYLQSLNNETSGLASEYDSYIDTPPEQITTQHHGLLNRFVSISNTLRQSGIYSLLLIDPKSELQKVSDAISFANEILANKKTYDEAIGVFRDAVKNKDDLLSSLLADKATLFNEKAKEHEVFRWHRITVASRWKTHGYFRLPAGIFWWMLVALASGLATAYVASRFIASIDANGDMSIGAALIRISALAIPAYFTFFSVGRFLNHKRLYESYKFKAIAINTMAELYRTYPEEKAEILNRAVSIIFTDSSSSKEETPINQKELMNLMINWARKQ